MARWRTALLGSAAAVAMLAAEPARAIVINDQEAAAVGGIANYYDQNNQFPNVGSLNSGCTGSFINSRTVLTAAHCLYNSKTGQPITNLTGVSFVPDPNRPVAASLRGRARMIRCN